MRKTFITTTVVALALALAACSTSNTKFQSTWRNPDTVALDLGGQKVLAVYMSNNPSKRYRAEDAMARELSARGAVAVAAHTVLTNADLRDSDLARQKARDQGFSAAVIVRITGSETKYTYTPGYWTGSPYRRLWGPGYWRFGWGTVWEPGYLSSEKVVHAETLFYSLDEDELLWEATSKTFNPGRMDNFVSNLTKEVSKELSKSGVITSL